METESYSAPSVVAVMVVHQPGDWFDDTLRSLADQDYPNLRTLFLVTSRNDVELDELSQRISAFLPSAFIRPLSANTGFGSAANEVLRLVEGDNGFFLICHDDVALESGVVRLLVAELFRSNAGLVGPKLTEWDDPRMLQHVGLGLDRFGEVDPVVDADEADQEQHDAVRDVFVLPSACFLIRADLFRTLGGFDPAISFHGDDIDLCWRAHLTGARVIVAPDARVRHLERLSDRRPDLSHRTLRARHRMRIVATLTGGSRLLGRSIQLVLLTLVELVVGLFTGRFGEALSSLRALGGLLPRSGAIIARRRAIRGQRVVPEREVLGLQDPGSSRLTSYLRGKDTETFVGTESTVRRWREASFGPLLAWLLVIVAVVVGSRDMIQDGVPPVGEFLPFPDSPSGLWADYRSTFDARGFGATAALPTAYAVVAVASVLAFFNMGLFLTMTVVGLILLGVMGAWRLATVFPVNRARIAGMVIYAGTPLVPGILSRGGWSALAWYAALPWLVHLLRRAAGIETADPDAHVSDLADGVVAVGVRHRVRALAFLTLALATVAAFVPVALALWVAVGVLLAAGTLVARGSIRVASWFLGCTVVSTALAVVLNLPWALEWSWDRVAGVRPAAPTGRSLAEIATLAPTTDRFAVLGLALYVPLLAAIAITRAWRLTWSVRAGFMVVGFGALAVFAERGSLGVEVPATPLLATPVALGLSLSGAAIAGGFGSDVLGRGFGWRQPIALLANAAIVVGLVPAVLAIGHGAWHTPNTPMVRLLEAQLPVDPAAGDYRVLYVGDPRVIPVVNDEYSEGIAFGVTDAGSFDFTDRLLVPSTRGDDAVVRALDLIADGSTLRAGRILAPLGIRYVVVPRTDGAVSTDADPVPLPGGLVAALQNQLDLGSIYGPPTLEIFVNQAWFPAGAQLSGPTAAASRLAGEESLARSDLSQAVPSMVGFDDDTPAGVNEVAPGTVHLAVPYDEHLRLAVDGVDIESRPGFGVTTAFDVEEPGAGVLSYEPAAGRSWWRVAQIVLWLAVLAVAAGARSPFGRRRTAEWHDETLIDLTDAPPLTGVVAGEALGVPAWSDDDDADAASLDSLLDDEPPGASDPWPDADDAFEAGQPHDAGHPGDRSTGVVPSRPATSVRPAVPAGEPADDDEVDLAALVAQVEEIDGADE